jgi:hypothetical protein
MRDIQQIAQKRTYDIKFTVTGRRSQVRARPKVKIEVALIPFALFARLFFRFASGVDPE